MNHERRDFLRNVMCQAWAIYRQRHIPGCNVRSFADAMRNAWAWLRRNAVPVAPATRHLRLNTMVQSPIRRSLGGQAYAYTDARWAGRTTSAVGR